MNLNHRQPKFSRRVTSGQVPTFRISIVLTTGNVIKKRTHSLVYHLLYGCDVMLNDVNPQIQGGPRGTQGAAKDFHYIYQQDRELTDA